jgi:hypothetical protein
MSAYRPCPLCPSNTLLPLWACPAALRASLKAEFDAIPKALCLAHRDCEMAKDMMKEIYRSVVLNLLSQSLGERLIGLVWGAALD